MKSQTQQPQTQELIKFVPEKEEIKNTLMSSPWFISPTKNIVNPIIRMHNEIIDFILYVTPTEKEHKQNTLIQQRLNEIIESIFKQQPLTKYPYFLLAPFLNYKLYMKGNELEFFICLEQEGIQKVAQILKKVLGRENFKNINCKSLENKRKPQICIKMNDQQGKQIFIWIKNLQWHQYLKEVQESIKTIPQLKYIYIIFNCIVRQRYFHRTLNSIIMMAICDIFFFQRRKQRTRTLTENVLKFLQYYGMGTLQEQRIIYTPKAKNRYDIYRDSQGFSLVISSSQFSGPIIRDFFNLMKNRYRLISNFNFLPGMSILSYLVNPSDGQFIYF